MKSKLRNFCSSRNKKKTLNIRLRAIQTRKRNFVSYWKSLEQLKTPANELELLLSKIFISVRKQNGTEYEPGTLSGFQFFDTNKKKVSNHSVKDQCSTSSWSRRSAKLRCTAKRSQKFEKPRQLPFSISEATARNVCYPESWARYIRSVRRKPSQYLHYNTAKCLHSPTNPASGNFCRSAYWQVRRLHI